MEREGQDELGQGPWEEEGNRKCVICLPKGLSKEALPQTSVGAKEYGLWSQAAGL